MSILICGSLAYDTMMGFNEKFRLNRASELVPPVELYFTVPDMRRNFGGCAGNIAYNLKLLGLGDQAMPLSTVGTDFGPYAAWLEKCGIRQDYIKTVDHSYTAQTFVTLDVEDNKITAFHPGAMVFSQANRVPATDKSIRLGVIAPDTLEAMHTHAHQLAEAGIPMLFYPGIVASQMDGNELLAFIQQAQWVVATAAEWQHIQKATELSPERASERLKALIIHDGNNGAFIHVEGVCHRISGYAPQQPHDPSGGEEAFCAGILYGLYHDIDWETTGRIAALLWAVEVEHHGTQSHSFTLDEFKARFKRTFGYALLYSAAA
jgi:adenosine kinase